MGKRAERTAFHSRTAHNGLPSPLAAGDFTTNLRFRGKLAHSGVPRKESLKPCVLVSGHLAEASRLPLCTPPDQGLGGHSYSEEPPHL